MNGQKQVAIQHSPHREQLAVAPQLDLEMIAPEIVDARRAVVLLDTIQIAHEIASPKEPCLLQGFATA